MLAVLFAVWCVSFVFVTDLPCDAATFEVEHKTVRQDHAKVYIQQFIEEACDSVPIATEVEEDDVEGCKVRSEHTLRLLVHDDICLYTGVAFCIRKSIL